MAAIYADAAAFGSFGFKTLNEVGLSDIGVNMTASHILPNDLVDLEYLNAASNAALCSPAQVANSFTLEDFIVFAEFSEVTGPIPLLTIPSHIAHIKDFDINNFIMQIMSVDYQGNPSCGGRFQTSEDVQVLQSEKGLHAYVHYTMLHDLLARGWVRPLCIAYISSDGPKLHTLFPVLRKMFLKMTTIMKYNNRVWFIEEILKVIKTFKEEQGKYFYSKKRVDDGYDLSSDEEQTLKMDIDQMVHQYTEYKHLLHCIEPLLDDYWSRDVVGEWKSNLALAEPNIPQVASYLSQLSHELETPIDPRLKGLHLRSILALCPWGFAASIWMLLTILQKYSSSYFNKQHIPWGDKEIGNSQFILFVEKALVNSEYLSLLEAVSHPLELGLENHGKEDSNINNVDVSTVEADIEDHQGYCSGGSTDANVLSSGTEASSYHSVSESFSDLPKDLEHSSDESYLDISETFQTDDSSSENETESPHEIACVWNRHELIANPSYHIHGKPTRLLKFLRTFNKEACHLLYALMIGRTVVLAGNEMSRKRISRFIASLCPLVPVGKERQVSSMSWHCGILVTSHISVNQLIGLCVPERLAVLDMINTKDKNSVSILDVMSKQLFGPAYSGHFLASMEKMLPNFVNDDGLQLYFQSISTMIDEKIFVYKHAQQYTFDKSQSKLKRMGLLGCDSEIVKYFYEL